MEEAILVKVTIDYLSYLYNREKMPNQLIWAFFGACYSFDGKIVGTNDPLERRDIREYTIKSQNHKRHVWCCLL